MTITLIFPAVSAEEIRNSWQDDRDVQTYRKPFASDMLYGFLSLSVFPGYKRIYFDKETVIGFSERILVPTGSHWLEIQAPEGYADTTFEIIVSSGKTLKKTVRLRNEQSGLLAPAKKKEKGSKNKVWMSALRATCLTVGVISGFFTYQEELYASTAQERYKDAGPSANFGVLYSDFDEHLQRRNILGIVSGVFLSVGMVLWLF